MFANYFLGGEKDSSKSEMKRSRSDLSTVILQQLTTPLGKATTCWTPLTEDLADYTVRHPYYIVKLKKFNLIFLCSKYSSNQISP